MRDALHLGQVGLNLGEQGSLPVDGALNDLCIYGGSWWRHDGATWVEISGSGGITEAQVHLLADGIARSATAAHALAVDAHGISRTVDQVRQFAAADVRAVVAGHELSPNVHRQIGDQAVAQAGSVAASHVSAHALAVDAHGISRTVDQVRQFAAADVRAVVAGHELSPNVHRQIGDQAQALAESGARRVSGSHELSTNPHRQYALADQASLSAAFFGG